MHGRLLHETDGVTNMLTDALRYDEDLCLACQLEGICQPRIMYERLGGGWGQRLLLTHCRDFEKKVAA